MGISVEIGFVYFLAGCIIAVLAFYNFYCTQASRSQKDPELLPLLWKAIKFAGLIVLFFVLLRISHKLCEHYKISFLVQFLISCVMALALLVCFYFFDIKNPAVSNDSTEKMKKKNEGDSMLPEDS